MKSFIRVRNISKERVGIVSIGDVKPNAIIEIPKKAWKLLHKPWPASRPYRCEKIAFLVPVDKRGNIIEQTEPKPRKRRTKRTEEKPTEGEKKSGIVDKLLHRGN